MHSTKMESTIKNPRFYIIAGVLLNKAELNLKQNSSKG